MSPLGLLSAPNRRNAIIGPRLLAVVSLAALCRRYGGGEAYVDGGDRRQMLGNDSAPGEGTIHDVRRSGHKNASGDYGLMPHFIADVRPSPGEPLRAGVEELVVPSAGHVVQLDCDPGRKRVEFARSDPAMNRKLQDQAHAASYEAELNAPPGTLAADTDPGARAHWREG